RITYRPIPSHFEREIPNQLSREAFSIEEMLEKVDHLLNHSSSKAEIQHDKEADQKLRERLSNVNGALAADRIVDAWEKIAEQYSLVNNPIDIFSTYDALTS